MKKITVIYSNLCEANGAFLGQLREWLDGYDIEISAAAYHEASTALNPCKGVGSFLGKGKYEIYTLYFILSFPYALSDITLSN